MKYLLILSLLFVTPAWAAESKAEKGALVSLNATASMQIPNDEVVVAYRIEATGRDPGALRKQVNQISQTIHTSLKHEQDIKQNTLNRRMDMLWRYDKASSKQMRDGWKLVQREEIISRNLDAAANWINRIEKAGANLDNLNFRIAEDTMNTTTDSLRMQAIANFRSKAAHIANALDAKSFRISHLQTSNGTPNMPINRRPEMTMMKMSADIAPSLNAGEGKVSVTVSGNIQLPPKDYFVQ